MRRRLGAMHLVLSTLGIAATILAASFFTRTSTWTSSLLINVGTAVFLCAPVTWFAFRYERSLSEVEERGRERVERLEVEVIEVRDELRRSLEELSNAVSGQMRAMADEHAEVFDALRTEFTQRDVHRALVRAAKLGITSTRGIRVELPRTEFFMWLNVSEDALDELDPDPFVSVSIEDQEFQEVFRLEWEKSQETAGCLASIGHELFARGRYPGDHSFQPAMAFENVADLLGEGLRQWSRGRADRVRKIMMIEGRWAISVTGIVSLDEPYSVLARRFDEIDWKRQVGTKTWVDYGEFETAFDMAYLLRQRGRVG